MAYSSLVSYVQMSPNKTSPRNHIIDTITIHCMAFQGSVESCGNVFASPSRQASSNYGIGPDGRIGCYVDENDRSWCSGGTKISRSAGGINDHRAVTIEVACDPDPPYVVTNAAMGALIALLVDICYRNNIWELKWRGDPKLIGQPELQNMTVHRWFAYKACPGDYLYERHGNIAAAVNEQLRNIKGFREKIAKGTRGGGLSGGQTGDYQSGGSQTTPGSGSGSGQGGSGNPGGTGGYAGGGYYTPEGKWVQVTTSPIQSSLVDYTSRLTSKAYENRSGTDIINKITVHIAWNVGTLDDLTSLLNDRDKAYNYGIDSNGNIGLFVNENKMTYSCGEGLGRQNDNQAVNIICMNESLEGDYPLSTSTWNALVVLCADICRRNSIKRLVYTNNPSTDNLTRHSSFQFNTSCPGGWVTKKLYDLADAVNYRIKNTPESTEINQVYLEALKDMSTISIQNTHPYVVRVDKGAVDIDWSKLKSIGVVGAMINAGERYNKAHFAVPYRSEDVYTQAREAALAYMPFGFYYTTHARTIEEVREEAYWFYFVVSKYPPQLGAWIHCEFDVDSDVAAELVDKWYEYLTDWGLKTKCGLYCSREQAELIGWPNQSTYMALWLEQYPSESAAPDEEVLVPAFFSWLYVAGKNF